MNHLYWLYSASLSGYDQPDRKTQAESGIIKPRLRICVFCAHDDHALFWWYSDQLLCDPYIALSFTKKFTPSLQRLCS